jgi:hypothetical protein
LVVNRIEQSKDRINDMLSGMMKKDEEEEPEY